jgi:hypothetical protein
MFKPYSKSARNGAGDPEGPPQFRQLARGVKSRLKTNLVRYLQTQ